jgi:hypothetical protein
VVVHFIIILLPIWFYERLGSAAAGKFKVVLALIFGGNEAWSWLAW